jgi:hypothetical protein
MPVRLLYTPLLAFLVSMILSPRLFYIATSKVISGSDTLIISALVGSCAFFIALLMRTKQNPHQSASSDIQ